MTNGRTEWRSSDLIESGDYSQRPRRKRAGKANRPRNVIAFATHVMGGVGACLSILLIGFTRIYLGAHFLSDVLGALAAGILWLTFCWTAIETLRRR
jgi:membrane-associated phospholipid phosphatase